MLTLLAGLVSLSYSYSFVCMCLTARVVLCVGKMSPDFFPSHSDGLGRKGLGLTFCLFINLRSQEC